MLVFKLYVGNIDIPGSARVFGYTVYRGFLNWVYGISQLKYGFSLNFRYKVYLGVILGIFG